MLRLFGIVLSIGLADSMNPSTIAPGLYLAVGERARSSLIQFTLAVFAVNLVGGAVIALGPGQVILHLVPHPHATARYILETIAGVVMLIAAAVLWFKRKSLRQRELPSPSSDSKSAIMLGLTISAVELPTAFPYFAAIAAIVGSGLGVASQLIALALYNVAFVLPLILMIIVLQVAGDNAKADHRGRARLVAEALADVGRRPGTDRGRVRDPAWGHGLASGEHNTVGHLSREFRHAVHH